MLEGICHPSNNHIYYPLSSVHNIQNHDDTVNMAKLINEETNKTQKDKMTKETGFFFRKNCICIELWYTKYYLLYF